MRLRMSLKQPEQAIQIGKRLLQAQPQDAEVLEWMAECHAQLPEWREVKKYAELAIKANPQSTGAQQWITRASAHSSQ